LTREFLLVKSERNVKINLPKNYISMEIEIRREEKRREEKRREM